MRIIPLFLTKRNPKSCSGPQLAHRQLSLSLPLIKTLRISVLPLGQYQKPIAFPTQMPGDPINKVRLSYALTSKVSLHPFPISLCVTNGNLETINLFAGLQAQRRQPVLTLERLVWSWQSHDRLIGLGMRTWNWASGMVTCSMIIFFF